MCCFPTRMFTSGLYIWPRCSSPSHAPPPTDFSLVHCTILSHTTLVLSNSFAHLQVFAILVLRLCLRASHPSRLLGKSAKSVSRKSINRVEEGSGFQNKAAPQHGGGATRWKSKQFDGRFEDKQKSPPDKYR